MYVRYGCKTLKLLIALLDCVIAMLFTSVKRDAVLKPVMNFDPEKSALCQHVLEHDHVIDWENVKILKSEPRADRRRTAESFLINQKAKEFNVLNRNDGAILPGVYKTLLNC